MTAIRLNCSIGYGHRVVVPALDLEIGSGVTVLIGANGTGKSTLLRTIAGVQRPLGGTVMIGDTDVSAMSRRRLAQTLSFVYTDREVSGGLTVRELVEMGRYPYTGILGRLSAEDREKVNGAMADVGIIAKADAFLSQISDGERQKAMIARALAQETPVILLDEPTSYLDAASRLEILALLRRLAEEHDKTVLLSTHDTSAALTVADNVLTIIPDRVATLCAVGSPELAGILNDVFAARGITYDPVRRDFTL